MPEALSILIVDDEKITAFYLKDLLTAANYEVFLAQNGEDALEQLSRRKFDLVITDLIMPGIDGFALVRRIKQIQPNLPVFILTAHGSFDIARKAQNMGADDYLLKPINPDQLHAALVKTLFKSQQEQAGPLSKLGDAGYAAAHIIGKGERMQEVFRLIEKARASRAHVLIRGESGTGKELAARSIFTNENHNPNSFVVVNCCAISEGLIESELFGHARGAFSGALTDREGLFEMAEGGTIFLDEIGDIPLRSQTKLLRILQDGEFRRVGENKVRHVHVRVIAATNRDLETAIEQGQFREDLFYRLNVIPISLPPLRFRLDDLPLLIEHFLSKHQKRHTQKITLQKEALELLMQYAFPGNIRELENLIQRAISFAQGNEITKAEVESYLRKPDLGFGLGALSVLGSEFMEGMPSLSSLQAYPVLKNHLQKIERDFVIAKLKGFEGSVSDAAKAMEITRTALHNRMKKLGINSKDIKGKDFKNSESLTKLE